MSSKLAYSLAFVPQTLKEWKKLDPHTRQLFKTRLIERLEMPLVASAQLSGHPDRYKIKLRALGYRLVYEVRDLEVLVVIVAVGRRDGNAVYLAADGRDSTAH
jgi:mRNA interferase RelE/StbE